MAITNDQISLKIGADTKDLLDSLDKLKDISIIANDSTIKLDDSIKNISKTQIEYSSAISKSNSVSESGMKTFSELALKADQLSQVMKSVNDVLNNANIPEEKIKSFTQSFDKLSSTIELTKDKLKSLSEEQNRFNDTANKGIGQTIDNTSLLSNAFSITSSIIKTAATGITAYFLSLSGISIFKKIMQEGFDFGKIISGLGESFKGVFSSIISNINGANNVFSGLKISIADLYKGLSVSGVGLASLASYFGENDVAALAFTQTLNFTSAAFIAFSIGIKLALHALGSFIESIGDKLIGAMDSFAEKFAKTQQIAVQFGFVVENFGKAYGSNFIGSLSKWEDQISSLAKTTTFSGNEIRKAAKIVIAENQALGMSYDDNVKFLNRSVEIAASSGLDLVDVVQRLQSALMGNSTAVGALGINLNSHAIEHNVLNKVMQKTVGTMTSLEKQQISLAEIYRQTDPLVGASIKQGETIIGINTQIANSYGSIQSKIGSVNILSISLSKIYSSLLKSAENLPDSVFNTVGALTDILGVTFKVVGITLQWLLVIGSLHTAYKLFNIALATNLAFQSGLNNIFSKLGLSLALNITNVTTASSVFKAFGSILKGGFILLLSNAAHALMNVAESVMTVGVSILTNPLFIAGAAITIGVIALIKALDELNDDFKLISFSMNELGINGDSLSKIFFAIKDAFSGSFNALVQSIKIVIVSLAEIINYAKLAGSFLGNLFNPKDSKIYNKNIDATLDKLDTLTASHEKALDSIAIGFMGANEKIALHAKFIDEAGKATDELAFKQGQLKKAADSIDMNTIRIDILGTEVEKLTNKYIISAKEATKFSKEVLTGTEVNTEAIKNYKKSLEDQAAAGFNLDKLKIDSIKEISNLTKEARKNSLKNNNDETKAILAEFDERRDKVKEYEKTIANLGPVSIDSAKKIKEAYGAINDAEKSSLNAARIKSLEELKKKVDEYAKSSESIGITEADTIKKKAAADIIELQNIAAKIKGNNELLNQKKALLETGIKNIGLKEQLELSNLYKKSLDEVEKKNEEINTATKSVNALTRDKISYELENQLKLLKIEQDKLDLQDEGAKKVFDAIESQKKAFNQKAEKDTVQAPSKTFEGLKKIGSDVANQISGVFSEGALGMVAGAVSMVGLIVEAINAALDIIPNLINSIASIFNKVTDFPDLLASVFKNLFGSITRLISDFIPNLVRSIITSVIDTTNFAKNIVTAVETLMTELPKSISEVFSNPKIFLDMIVAITSLLWKIPWAVISGLANLLKGWASNLSKFFKGTFGGKKIKVNVDTATVKKDLQKLSGATGKLFNVSDLTDAVKDPVKNIMQGIGEAFNKGKDAVKGAWQWVMDKIITPIVAALKAVWDVVILALRALWDTLKAVWDVIIQALSAVWEVVKQVFAVIVQAFATVWEAIKQIFDVVIQAFSAVWEAAKQIFQVVIDAFSAVWEAAKQIFQFIIDAFSAVWEVIKQIFAVIIQAFVAVWEAAKQIFQVIIDAYTAVWEAAKTIFNKVIDGLKSVWDGLRDAVEKAFEPVKKLWDGLKEAVDKAFSGIKDFFSNFKIEMPKIGGGGSGGDIIKKIGNALGLADGGVVYAADGMMIPSGTDTVPAMLTPGEFIMSRPAVAQIGLNNLRSMNAGNGVGSSNNYNIQFEINIDAKTPMDEGFIRATLIPRMQDEMKRASLEGKFVLSQKGIR